SSERAEVPVPARREDRNRALGGAREDGDEALLVLAHRIVGDVDQVDREESLPTLEQRDRNGDAHGAAGAVEREFRPPENTPFLAHADGAVRFLPRSLAHA